MTGTGTQAEPYIVDSWEDFKTAARKQRKYVKFADGGGTIDMLEIYPDGLTESIDVYANVDGNGWDIKNFHVLNKRIFAVYNKIKNLNFIDFNVSGNEGSSRFILLRAASQTKGHIEHCIFSGTISGKYASFIEKSNDAAIGAPVIFGCACNLSFLDGAVMADLLNTRGIIYSQSCFYIDASNNAGISPIERIGFHYCLIRGKMHTTALESSYTQYSIFDIVCPSISVKSNSKLSKDNFIVGNVDIASYNENVFYGLTTEQLKDMEYLLSLGFPIGNEEITTTIINFEKGSFDAVTGDESIESGNRSEWIPITNTAIIPTIDSWIFKCRDADGNFRYIPTSEYSHIFLNVVILTEYPWIAEVKIGSYIGVSYKEPSCILYNGYPWQIDSGQNNGMPFPALAPKLQFSSTSNGAYKDAVELTEIYIPESVKKIGSYSFSGTSLTSAKIAPDCEYSETSFPSNCVVEFYGDGDYGQLYDADGFALLDSEGARIYSRSENNG